jgi:hypothetical protein
MRIKYGALINHEVRLNSIDDATLDGTVVVRGDINGKQATLTLSPEEGVKFLRRLKEMDIEGLALVHSG